jgi:large subunit ribosomal protein L4
MEATIYNQKGAESGKITLPDEIFGLPWNGDLVHQVVTSMRASEREPWAHTKDRGQVAGGGKKPWQQKGTGRARHGSIRSPLWVGGGVTHGPNSLKNYNRKVNRKMVAKALFTILSKKLSDGEILFVEKMFFDKPKTSEAKLVLEKLSSIKGFEGITKKKSNAAFVALLKKDKNTEKSLRNFSNITIEDIRNINPVSVLDSKYLIVSEPKEAIAVLSAKLNKK